MNLFRAIILIRLISIREDPMMNLFSLNLKRKQKQNWKFIVVPEYFLYKIEKPFTIIFLPLWIITWTMKPTSWPIVLSITPTTEWITIWTGIIRTCTCICATRCTSYRKFNENLFRSRNEKNECRTYIFQIQVDFRLLYRQYLSYLHLHSNYCHQHYYYYSVDCDHYELGCIINFFVSIKLKQFFFGLINDLCLSDVDKKDFLFFFSFVRSFSIHWKCVRFKNSLNFIIV